MSNNCPTCGKELSTEHGVKIHHAQVHGESISGEIVDCDNCGNTVRKRPYLIERSEYHYCSSECQYSHRSESWSGENHPNWSKVERVCEECGNSFNTHKYRLEDASFCSHSCYHKSMELPESFGYGVGWSAKKREIREKYSHSCAICGESCEEQHHDVHHIIPARDFDKPSDAHYDENLVLLCRKHHRKVEHLSIEEQCERLNRNTTEVEV